MHSVVLLILEESFSLRMVVISWSKNPLCKVATIRPAFDILPMFVLLGKRPSLCLAVAWSGEGTLECIGW